MRWYVLTFASFAVLVTALGLAKSLEPEAVNPVTLCPIAAAPLHSELVLVDQTDPLALDNVNRLAPLFEVVSERTGKNMRLTIAGFGGDLSQSPNVEFDQCSPGSGGEHNWIIDGGITKQREYEQGFVAPLNETVKTLAVNHETPLSPISTQILRAASDPSIRWKGDKLTLTVMSDFLEHTSLSAPYANAGVSLPPAPKDALKGVTVRMVELVNAKRPDLQTDQVREAWRLWFLAAGAAVVIVSAPGYER